jgi:hypothetical protein
MIRRSTFNARTMVALSCSALLLACTEEDPSGIGGALLPDGEVQTFQVILDPEDYLVLDTAFAGYVQAFNSSVRQVMLDFEGVTSANALYRHGVLPTTLQVVDSAGTTRTDSAISFPSGYLLVRLDTLRSRGTATVGAYQTGEFWDAATTTWTVRSDTGGVRLLWQQPGGTRGALLGNAAWSGSGTDTVTIPLDSAKIRMLTDTANHERGLVLVLDQAGTNGASLRVTSASLRLSGKSTIRPDTTVVVTIDPIISAFVFTPDRADSVSAGARVSGVPAWRSMLTFRDDLRNVDLPCPGTGCTVRLSAAHVNLAELLLQPTGSPPGYSPEDSIRVIARTLLESPQVPLARSPIGEVAGATRSTIPASRFTNADTGPEVGLVVTDLIGAIGADTATTAADRIPHRIVLLTDPESLSFGFASFRAGPRLRLILTISTPESRP